METIGPYGIQKTIQAGARPLYLALALDGRTVALKTVAVDGLPLEARERFTREAAICVSLDHPNVVKVYDMGEARGVLYQATEFLEGSDLQQVVSAGRAFSWAEKLGIMEQVCEGLAYVHSRNLVHRDIKPANLMLETSGRVRILNFGMARMDASTADYMAPEQIRGETSTAASDVFAAGVVFYQLACGGHPFGAAGMQPPTLKDLTPDAPEGLEFVLQKALDKDPAHRWQNGAELKQALSLCLMWLSVRTAPAASSAPADLDKTVIMERPAAPAGPRRAPAAKPPSKPTAPKPAPAKADVTFCSRCTNANPVNADVCSRCGLPLKMLPADLPEAREDRTQWMMYAGVAAVLVALLLIWVLAR